MRRALFAQGFIASRVGIREIPDHYAEIVELGGYSIYQDERVPAQVLRGAGFRAALLGHVGNVRDEAPVEELILESYRSGKIDDLAAALDWLVGRWVLIFASQHGVHVFHDAVGSRSVFYAEDGSVFASHARLLTSNHASADVRAAQPRQVTQDYALDQTEVDGIRALLPNFSLEALEGRVARYFPVRSNPYAESAPEQLLDEIETMWRRGARWTSTLPYRQVAPLTAGIDSRVMAAVQLGEVDNCEYFTYRMRSAGRPSGFSQQTWDRDVQIGSRIAALVNKPHRIIESTHGSASAYEKETLLTNSPLGHGVDLAASYQREFGPDLSVLHRSTTLEIGREYYTSKHFTGSAEDEIRRILKLELSKAPVATLGPTGVDGLATRYLDQMGLLRAGQLGYSMTSLLYWEMRCGRFHADVLTGMDTTFIPINPFSSRAFWNAVLAVPQQLRLKDWLHWNLIQRRLPETIGLPVNGKRKFEELLDSSVETPKIKELRGTSHASPLKLRYATLNGPVHLLRPSLPNVAFVPSSALGESGWSEASRTVLAAACGFDIAFRMPYALGRATGVMRLELRLNDHVILTEDVGHTAETVHARITGLTRGDIVALRVAALHPLPDSWQGASRLEILEWSTMHSSMDFCAKPMVGWSSPWGLRVETEH